MTYFFKDTVQVENELKNLLQTNGFIVDNINIVYNYSNDCVYNITILFKLNENALLNFLTNSELDYITKGIMPDINFNKSIKNHRNINTMYKLINNDFCIQIDMVKDKYNYKNLYDLDIIDLNYKKIKEDIIKTMIYNNIELKTTNPYQYNSEDVNIIKPLLSKQIKIVHKFKKNINNKLIDILNTFKNKIDDSKIEYVSSKKYSEYLIKKIESKLNTDYNNNNSYDILSRILIDELTIYLNNYINLTNESTLKIDDKSYSLVEINRGLKDFDDTTNNLIQTIYRQIKIALIQIKNNKEDNDIPNLNKIVTSTYFEISHHDNDYIYLKSVIPNIDKTYYSKDLKFNLSEYLNIKIIKSNYTLDYNLDIDYINNKFNEIITTNSFSEFINAKQFNKMINEMLYHLEYNLFELSCHIESIKNKYI